MINHISLDYWNTLMVSNNNFSTQRLDFLKKNHFQNKSLEELHYHVEKIGDESDHINMTQGISIPSETMYANLFQNLGKKISDNEAKQVYSDLEIFFLDNPPKTLYDIEALKKALIFLKNKNFTINISSNTAYIKGSTLRKIFKHYDLLDCFDFLIFSDEINCSKPSKYFFEDLETKCSILNVSKNNILHIGDSIEADVEGANSYNIKSKYIDYKKDDLIEFLMNLHNKNK